jgi:hypothetical protein
MYGEEGDEITVRRPLRRPSGMFEVRVGASGMWLFLAREQAEQLHTELGRALAAAPDQDGA